MNEVLLDGKPMVRTTDGQWVAITKGERSDLVNAVARYIRDRGVPGYLTADGVPVVMDEAARRRMLLFPKLLDVAPLALIGTSQMLWRGLCARVGKHPLEAYLLQKAEATAGSLNCRICTQSNRTGLICAECVRRRMEDRERIREAEGARLQEAMREVGDAARESFDAISAMGRAMNDTIEALGSAPGVRASVTVISVCERCYGPMENNGQGFALVGSPGAAYCLACLTELTTDGTARLARATMRNAGRRRAKTTIVTPVRGARMIKLDED